MSNIAIKVESLGKRYRIGAKEQQHETLFGAATSWLKSPLQNFRNLKRLSTFDEDEQNNDIIWALRDVSFEVERGEVLGVIGRNGAGKSTLLKILSKITEPTRGRIELSGRVSSLLEVGTGFHSELTGRENVYLNGTVLGMSRSEVENKFREIVEFSGIKQFLDTPVKRYSSGMKVRLAFAVAAHLDPEILLIDEVLAVGDFAFQEKCLGKMDEVASSGRTVLFVSHQMDMVRSLCDRCVLVDDGKLTEIGPVDRIVDHYISVAADSIDKHVELCREPDESLPIQLLEARLTDDEGEPRSLFDAFDEVRLELVYEVRESITGAICYAEVDHRNSPFFWTFDTDANPALLKNRRVGRHRYVVEFPTPLFKPGHYSINLGAGIANVKQLDHVQNALGFEVSLMSRPSTFLSLAEKRPGLIATELEWHRAEDEP